MALGTTALLKKRWLQLLDRDDFPLDTSLTNASGNTIYADAIRVKRAETAPGASHPDTIPVADVPAGLTGKRCHACPKMPAGRAPKGRRLSGVPKPRRERDPWSASEKKSGGLFAYARGKNSVFSTGATFP